MVGNGEGIERGGGLYCHLKKKLQVYNFDTTPSSIPSPILHLFNDGSISLAAENITPTNIESLGPGERGGGHLTDYSRKYANIFFADCSFVFYSTFLLTCRCSLYIIVSVSLKIWITWHSERWCNFGFAHHVTSK